MTEPIPWPVDRLVAQLGRWSTSRGPLYLLLAERLRQLIDSGQLPARAALPPDRTLARKLAVGRSTVVSAYDRLREDGKLARHQGRGTWVAPTVLTGARPESVPSLNPLFLNYLEPPDGVLSLACTAPHGPSPELLAAFHRAITALPAQESGDIGYYPMGQPALRQAIADRYTRHGLPTTSRQILVTTGCQQALALVTRLFVSPGDVVLVPTPVYPGALELFRDAVAIIEPVPHGTDGLDVTAWTTAMTQARPRLAYLNLSNHNPTGTTVPALARRRLAEVAAAQGTALIDDTTLDGLGFDHAQPPGLASFGLGQVLTVGSLSKTLWGGLRLGWIRAAEGEIAQLARIKSIQDLGTAALEQLAAAELLPRLDEISVARAAVLRERHDHLCELMRRLLPDWRFRPADGGQCLWLELPEGDASAFAQVALRHRVAVLPGAALDPTGRSAAFLRIACTATPAELTLGAERLADAWRAYRKTGGTTPVSVPALVV